MAAKLRIIWDNRYFDAATLTPSSAATNFPAVNVQDKLRKRTWRTTGLTGQYLTADLGQSLYCTCLALINHNLTFAGKVTVQASDDPAFGTLLKDDEYDAWADIIGYGEGGFGGHGFGGVILEADRAYYAPEPIRIIYFDPVGDDQVMARYWRLRFTDAANPDGYLEVGRVFLGLFDEYAKQFSYGWEYAGEDDSEITYSVGGQPWIDRRPLRRALKLSWRAFSREDKYWRFLFFLRQVGLSRDFIIDPVPDGQAAERFFTAMYGRFSDIPSLVAAERQFNEMELSFVESL